MVKISRLNSLLSRFSVKSVFVTVLHLILVVELLLATMGRVDAQKVTYYEHYKRQGKSLEMVVHSLRCTPLPRRWREMTSSVDSHGSCLVFYEFPDCTGRHMTLRPGTTTTFVSNLKKIRFNDVISSAKACTPKVALRSGRYAIQSMDDKKFLTAQTNSRRGYTVVDTEPWKNRISQHWDAVQNSDGTFWLIPRIHLSKNPLTYNLRKYKPSPYPEPGMFPDREYWNLQHLQGSKYLIRNDATGRCLVMEDEVEEADECDGESKSHQWSFHKLKV